MIYVTCIWTPNGTYECDLDCNLQFDSLWPAINGLVVSVFPSSSHLGSAKLSSVITWFVIAWQAFEIQLHDFRHVFHASLELINVKPEAGIVANERQSQFDIHCNHSYIFKCNLASISPFNPKTCFDINVLNKFKRHEEWFSHQYLNCVVLGVLLFILWREDRLCKKVRILLSIC